MATGPYPMQAVEQHQAREGRVQTVRARKVRQARPTVGVPEKGMVDMTATDELRRMLDERGVEYKTLSFDDATWWNDACGLEWYYGGDDDGHTIIEALDPTPEQAIAATMGDVPRLPYFWTADGTLHIELPRLPESISVCLPEQRDREVGSARVWQYTQGSGTCNMEYCDEWSGDELYPTEAYVCSACGEITVDGKPNYCPNCGREAVDE